MHTCACTCKYLIYIVHCQYRAWTIGNFGYYSRKFQLQNLHINTPVYDTHVPLSTQLHVHVMTRYCTVRHYESYNDLHVHVLTILLTLREGDKCPTDGDAAARPKLSGLSPTSWLPATGVDVNSWLSDTILLFSNWRPGCWLNRSWLDIDSVVDSCLVTERGDISCPSGVGFTAGARGEFCSPCIDWFVPESNASLILEIDDCFVNCCWLWLLYGVCGDIGPKDCWLVSE